MIVHSRNKSGRRWGYTSLEGLVTDADQVGYKVSVDEMIHVSGEAGDDILHIEACHTIVRADVLEKKKQDPYLLGRR